MIAKDESELEDFTKKLSDAKFKQVADASDLLKQIEEASKSFVVAKDSLSKDLYDFAVQYSTGQVEIYDKLSLKSQVATPVYEDVAVVYLLTKATLKKTQESGFRILEVVGVTYQA